ncbi:dihydropteridine reductase [Conidiobolus coronatus NRRL 28638]|uniref:Dihydropteridine reductase n=1 Tax=Conidiobolus coronatus (strain ATCC 28846 / CBS 209.66 / NRRL 28638) TaxID=796925 RepID=A0A137P8H0_CONC2|nr:dihydropteridine reductase [Conidiobolus coronatus NRRL 28638]|eukprot:KXN71306.1 dihydropteridine reductase [Conidiobolus coronatus NRRL 28638]
MSAQRLILFGSNGALGQAIKEFFNKQQWTIFSIDVSKNDDQYSFTLDPTKELNEQAKALSEKITGSFGEEKVDAIVNVAGGWAGGNSKDEAFLQNSLLMYKQSVESSLLSAHIASKFLKNNGLLVLTGAKAALGATPGMIGYGMAKASVHHLVQSLAAENGGLPSGAKAIAILPVTLDTPSNRKWITGADYSTWTPLEAIATQVFDWATSTEQIKNGKLFEIITQDNQTSFL